MNFVKQNIAMISAHKITTSLRIQATFWIAVMILVWPIATSYPPAAVAVRQDSKIQVQVKEGRVSVYAENSALRDILLRMSEVAGVKLVLYGELETPVTQSFSGVSLIEGIRLLAGNHAVVILHQTVDAPDASKAIQDIAEVWVFDNDGSQSEAQIADPEPKKFKPDSNSDFSESSIRNDTPRSNPPLRREEILSLNEFAEDTEIGYWANILVTSHDRTTLQRAITELEWIGSDAAVAAIAIVLGDDDALLRRHAVESLGNMNSDHTAPLLGQALIGDKDSSVRMTAVKIFASRRNEISQAFLRTALKDPDYRIRAFASQALSAFKGPN